MASRLMKFHPRPTKKRKMTMHTVMWTFYVPEGKTKDDLRGIIKSTAHNYLNISDLVRKYYGIADDGQSIVGIYLWKSRKAAERFYTPAWVQNVAERWGAVPTCAQWETPMVAETAQGRLVPA